MTFPLFQFQAGAFVSRLTTTDTLETGTVRTPGDGDGRGKLFYLGFLIWCDSLSSILSAHF